MRGSGVVRLGDPRESGHDATDLQIPGWRGRNIYVYTQWQDAHIVVPDFDETRHAEEALLKEDGALAGGSVFRWIVRVADTRSRRVLLLLHVIHYIRMEVSIRTKK